MKILLGCLSYRSYTGSELYFYELSCALRDAGHSVSIFSPFIDSPLRDKTEGVSFPTKEKVHSEKYDIVIFSHGKVIWDYIKNIQGEKFINVIHSEVIDLEEPIFNNKVNHYVGIRPSIVEHIKNIAPSDFKDKKVKLIYNPFDLNRFNAKKCKKKKSVKDKIVLFPGSLDYLRYKPLKYLLDLSVKQNFKVLHVGRNDYSTIHPNFTTQEPVWNIEKFYKQCDIVSGIFLGRTSIEGLLCGKKVLQFDVDTKGTIKEVYWHTEEDLTKFDRNQVASKIIE